MSKDTLFVAVRTDIAMDVRIDAGGGEIGDYTILGACLDRESAVAFTRSDSDRLFEEIRMEAETFEEMVDSHEYNYRYEIAEVPTTHA
jgi:hypothetical protein